jgi:hypothetical protein
MTPNYPIHVLHSQTSASPALVLPKDFQMYENVTIALAHFDIRDQLPTRKEFPETFLFDSIEDLG